MLQLIYAAPFLFAAGALFIALSSFSATRRYAITVPAGIVAFGPGSLITYLLWTLITYKAFGRQGPAIWLDWIVYAVGGLASAYIFTRFIQSLAPSLHETAFRLAVAGSAFCSYFVVLIAMHIALNIKFNYANPGVFAIGVYISIFLISSWAACHWFTIADSSSMLPRLKSMDPTLDTVQNI